MGIMHGSTEFLATAIGWYLVVIGLFRICRPHLMQTILSEITQGHAAFVVVATITFILGLLMVISHNIWVMDWPVVITVIAWVFLLAGIVRLFFPEFVMNRWRALGEHTGMLILYGVIAFVVGGFLLYHVYW